MTTLGGGIVISASNNFIFTNSLIGDMLVFSNSNSQRCLIGNNSNSVANLVLTSNSSYIMNGNVGIGTSNPAYTLDVNGTTRLNSAPIISTPVYVEFWGVPSFWQQSVGNVSTISNGTYISMYNFPNYQNANWTPSWVGANGQQGLVIPYNGIYNVKMNYPNPLAGLWEAWIVKNGTPYDNTNNTIAMTYINSAEGFLTSTVYLKTTDVVTYGFYPTNTYSTAAVGSRIGGSAHLLMRTV